MKNRFNIVVYDTRESETKTVRGVPGATLEEACQALCSRDGNRWVGSPGLDTDGIFYMIDEAVYRQWYKDADLEQSITEVRDGLSDEFRGLFQLYEEDAGAFEEWVD